MKKVQRSFVVEYKSRRHNKREKPDPTWGNIDLKSVARDEEGEPMPFMSGKILNGKAGIEVSLPGAMHFPLIVTPPAGVSKTLVDTQEVSMADETDKGTSSDKAAVAEPAVGLSGILGKKRKGRKAKATDGADVAKRGPVKRANTEVTQRTVPTLVGEEMTDLLQLEEENQKLRKLLAEKLRIEKVNLRKKLQLD